MITSLVFVRHIHRCVVYGSTRHTLATARGRVSLRQCNVCRAPCVSALSTSVGAQCRRQTYTFIYSRLKHRSSRSEHVTPMLRDLHWRLSPERIYFKLAVLVYRCLLCTVWRHGISPDHIQRVADSNRRHLRSSFSLQLLIRRTQLSTVGDRAFPVPGSRLWNSLLPVVTSAQTLTVFQNRLKTYLFSRSFSS